MAKAKQSPKPEYALVSRVDFALSSLAVQFRNDARMISNRLDEQSKRIRANEEAICPRVAARLTALERRIGIPLSKVQAPDLRSTIDFGSRDPITRWPTAALDKLAADLNADAQREYINDAFAIGKKLSRAARHELITKLLDLNGDSVPRTKGNGF